MTPLLLSLALLTGTPNPAETELAARPLLTVRIDRPDEQLTRFLSLFQGMPVSSPASALASWKLAKPGRGMSKAAEAGIAALNPEMIPELATLDRTTFVLKSEQDGSLAWWAVFPGDDGTFDALATAMALTDGVRLEPSEGQPVDRLGPAGAPLMSRGREGKGTILASGRPELTRARDFEIAQPPSTKTAGLSARLVPGSLGKTESVLLKRICRGLTEAGCSDLDLNATFEDESLRLLVQSRYSTPPALSNARLDPAWFSAVPSNDLVAAFGVAVEPSPAFWNGLFQVADQVEKSDPARAGLAPLRVRLALLTGGVGIRPEVDLFPHLKGISGFIQKAENQTLGAIRVDLHFADPSRAKTFATVMLPKIARRAGLGDPVAGDNGLIVWQRAGSKERLEVVLQDAEVRVAWGERAQGQTKKADPARAEKDWVVHRYPSISRAQRFLLIRPGLITKEVPESSEVVWFGESEGTTMNDEVRWTNLRSVVKQTLDRILPEMPK